MLRGCLPKVCLFKGSKVEAQQVRNAYTFQLVPQ